MIEEREKVGSHTPDQHPELFRAFAGSAHMYRTAFPRYWSPYKSVDEKLEYQRRLTAEIRPFIRKHWESMRPEISRLQVGEDLATYLFHTQEAWDTHIAVNGVVDCFLSYELHNTFGDWSLTEWRIVRRLLIAAMTTDQEKGLYSSGIKGKLDIEAKRLIEKYLHVERDIGTLLLSPSFVTFYEGRDYNHKRVVLSQLQGHADTTLQERVIERYHGGDERVFEERLRQICASTDAAALAADVAKYEATFRERAIKKRYLMLERPEIATFEALLYFDNATEYEYTYSLKGLPDLFLREEVLRRLIEAGEIDPRTSIFGITLEEYTAAIDRRLAKVERHFFVRLRPYRQNFDTCGTACIMSILNRKGTSLDVETELRIWGLVGKPFNFPGGLAWVLLRNGFHVAYWQDQSELLSRNNPEFAAMDDGLLRAAKTYVELHGKAVAAGLDFRIKDWDFSTVVCEILRGNVCLLYLYVTDTISHVVIARGIKNDRLEIIDPLGGIKYLAADQLNARIAHPMGKRMLVVKKLPDDFFNVLGARLASLGY